MRMHRELIQADAAGSPPAFSAKAEYDRCAEFIAMSCVECGCCTFTCPGNVHIVQHIRVAKGKLREKSRK